jgi:5-(carboxyamino)imidazole ribonucleotide synthase
MKTVGVLGGGQLAWMLAIAAEGLGVPFWAGTDEAQAPVQQVASARVVSTVDTLLAQVEACLFENEWVDVAPLQSWVDRIAFLPALPTLSAMVDKFHQRQTMAALGLPIPAFRAVHTGAELIQAGRDLGIPSSLNPGATATTARAPPSLPTKPLPSRPGKRWAPPRRSPRPMCPTKRNWP